MEVEGERVYSVNFHNGDGYFYRTNRIRNTKIGIVRYVRCVQSKCKGTGKIVGSGEVTVLNPHLINGVRHEPDLNLISKKQMISNLKRQVLETTNTLREVYDFQCERDPVGAQQVTFASVESTLRKQRQKVVPHIPANLDGLAAALEEPSVYEKFGTSQGRDGTREQFFRGLLGVENERIAVFATPTMCKLLEKAQEVHVDGTFKTVPRAAGMTQLVIIHMAIGDHTFPAVYALMTNKTPASYQLLLEHAKTVLAPGMSPTLFYSDYELGLMNAAKLVFPNTRLVGCWFHWSQALWKKCQSLGIVTKLYENRDAARAVKKCMVLPLLPAHDVANGLNEILIEADTTNVFDILEHFFEYLMDFWLGKVSAQVFSVFGCERRTNNNPEAFHRTLTKRLGGIHPGFWVFVERLGSVAAAEQRDAYHHLAGKNIRRPKKLSYVANDNNISEATKSYMNDPGEGRLANFLNRACHSVGGSRGLFAKLSQHE